MHFIRDAFFDMGDRSTTKTFLIEELIGNNDISALLELSRLKNKVAYPQPFEAKLRNSIGKQIRLKKVIITTDEDNAHLDFIFDEEAWSFSFNPTSWKTPQSLWNFKQTDTGSHYRDFIKKNPRPERIDQKSISEILSKKVPTGRHLQEQKAQQRRRQREAAAIAYAHARQLQQQEARQRQEAQQRREAEKQRQEEDQLRRHAVYVSRQQQQEAAAIAYARQLQQQEERRAEWERQEAQRRRQQQEAQQRREAERQRHLEQQQEAQRRRQQQEAQQRCEAERRRHLEPQRTPALPPDTPTSRQ